MDALLNLNEILNREHITNEITNILSIFDANVNNVQFKKGIYIQGSPGSGKTQFVLNLLKQLDFDVVKYDAGDVRNKSLIDTITSNNVSKTNVLNMMKRVKRRIAIVMDEIDGMNSGDKGGITSLIKLIRQKRTKKQKSENVTINPIICIGNYFVDKKIKELMKVCHVFELESPNEMQMTKLVRQIMPDCQHVPDILNYVQSDLRKLAFIHRMYVKKPELLSVENIHSIFRTKSYNHDAKTIVKKLFEKSAPMEEHATYMNETDRTTVALLWHENVIDMLKKLPKEKTVPFYLRVLDNICYADYIDRITFQNQIWIFNEMSSLMKTFGNNRLFHEFFRTEFGKEGSTLDEVRFTKVLTKYSTEYNNLMFVFALVQEMEMDRKDMIAFFQEVRLYFGTDFYNKTDKMAEVEKLFEDTNINKLDIRRVYRYLDKTVKRDTVASAIEDEYEVFDDDYDE